MAAGAVQAERARLAHDLHDVIAHHVSLIAVRAEAAPYTDPGMGARANDVFGEIADDARRALDELRGVLGVLHRAGETPELAPQPSIRDLPDLIDRATNAGDRITTDGVDDSWIVPGHRGLCRLPADPGVAHERSPARARGTRAGGAAAR